MGEAKAKRKALEKGDCPCRSGKPSITCCFDGRTFHKLPSVLGLGVLPPGSSLDKCYMKELGSCDGVISGEHLFTAAIMELLADNGDFTISGLPWIKGDKPISVGINSLKANCLCRKHNSALTLLDEAALKLFTALKQSLERKIASLKFLVSGHDIERWLLKTLKALAASGNLGKGREKLSGAFAENIQVIDMIDDPKAWPPTAGLYCLARHGVFMENNNRFQLQPLMNDKEEIDGLVTNMLGVAFVLLLGPLGLAARPELAGAVFRPNQILVREKNIHNWLAMSWEDGLPHTTTLYIDHVLAK
jgi:hypothetical protein